MSRSPPRWWMRLQWRVHRIVWDLSGGRLLARVNGMPVLELVTKGNTSGLERSILITFVETEDGPALAGTNAGAQVDPAWVNNLRANPEARFRARGGWERVRARWLDGEEHERIWSDFVAADPGYATYGMIERHIPIVVLEPTGDG